MSELDDKQILDEVMGAFTPRPPNQYYQQSPYYQAIQAQPSPVNNQQINPNISNITVSHCGSLEGWQRNIVNSLSGNTGTDQYIIARPGGGKTTPVICYWTDRLLNLNTMASTGMHPTIASGVSSLFTKTNRQNTPKILFMVPVIVLAQQTAMEIRKILASIMMQIYNVNPNGVIQQYLQDGNNNQLASLRNQIINLNGEVTNYNDPHVSRPSGPDPLNRINTSLNSLNQALKIEVENVIANMVNKMVFVKTGSFSSDMKDFDDALVFVTIYESAPNLISKIKELRLTIIDEAHLIQESGIIDDDNSRAYQISGDLFSTLKTLKKVQNNRLVLLSGTINPKSAANVTKYFNDCFGRNFAKEPVSAPPEAANRSQLSVIVNERISNDQEIVNSITRSVSQRDWGQLYVLFSTSRIRRVVEMCISKLGVKNIENSSPSGYEASSTFSGLGQSRQNNAGYKLDSSSVDRMSIPTGKQFQVSNITNPLLRQAVLRGIGFITRKIPGNPLEGRDEIKMNDDDKIIVAKLFRERKLNVLLATDSVGIGVNIDVKDLYIPEIQKHSSQIQNMVNASLRDLAQILNRAGRGATPIASIQTPSKNLEMVTNALYANPDDLPEVDEIRRVGISPCDHKSFMNLLNTIKKYV